MPKTLWLSGANGFVGATVLLHVLEHTDWNVVAPVTSLHHGSQTRLNHILDYAEKEGLDPHDRVRTVRCDLAQPFFHILFGGPRPDYIWNIASESHVDRSLADPASFIRNNVEMMVNVLEYARQVKPALFLQMSTDEVYGATDGTQAHKEWASIRPSNPYSASKASQEAVAYSYWRAYGIPLILTNTMNLICPGPGYQHPEKFVPKTIKALKNRRPVVIHSSPEGESGSRCWLDVRDFASAWLTLTQLYEDDETVTYYPTMPDDPIRYNIVGEKATNAEVAELLADIIGLDNTQYHLSHVNFHESRPGHDMHYALDGTMLKLRGWSPEYTLEHTLEDVVAWYERHPETLED